MLVIKRHALSYSKAFARNLRINAILLCGILKKSGAILKDSRKIEEVF
jgi:hypothetical protein